MIIPPNTVAAFDLLASEQCRESSDVASDNDYLFAKTKHSEDHTSEWHSLHRLMDKLNLKHPEKIELTTYRHRLSTVMASMDLTEQEGDIGYAHMGHSKTINQTTYQVHSAVMDLAHVGRQIVEVDEGELNHNSYMY